MNDSETIEEALDGIAYQLRSLGNGDASTPMGAIEAHGKVMKEGLESVASGLNAIAEAISELAGVQLAALQYRRKTGQ